MQTRLASPDYSPPDDEVVVFDFDGVLASPYEDDIFKVDPYEGEDVFLADASSKLGLKCSGMDQQYQRHLLYQLAAWKLRLPIEPGAFLPLAKKVNQMDRPWFVLTARSGVLARLRLDDFLGRHGLSPTEVFGIGRVGKHLQLEHLGQEFAGCMISFFEDSDSHIDKLAQMHFRNLVLYNVTREAEKQSSQALIRYFQEVIFRALQDKIFPNASGRAVEKVS